MKIEEYMESELSAIFRVKLAVKNINELFLQCQEKCKCSEPDSQILVFALLNNILVSYVKEKSFCLNN